MAYKKTKAKSRKSGKSRNSSSRSSSNGRRSQSKQRNRKASPQVVRVVVQQTAPAPTKAEQTYKKLQSRTF